MITAKKSLGQHFLINEGVAAKIVSAAELSEQDVVIEVGPGTGNLTKHLVGKASRLILIEKDRRLIESLKREFGNSAEIIEADVLALDPSRFSLSPFHYKIVANLPYYITSRFFKTVFETWPMPERMIVMVQKEVAKRIMAQPPDTNLLGLSVQFYAEPTIIAHVSAGSFRPIPEVDSSILQLIPRAQPLVDDAQRKLLFSILRAAFAGKRKKLSNTLSSLVPGSAFAKAGIDPSARPQHLALTQWLALLTSL